MSPQRTRRGISWTSGWEKTRPLYHWNRRQEAGRRDEEAVDPATCCLPAASCSLSRPQPAKRPRRQQPVDQAVHHFLDRHAPRLALPYAIAQVAEPVGEEACRARNAEDAEVVGA